MTTHTNTNTSTTDANTDIRGVGSLTVRPDPVKAVSAVVQLSRGQQTMTWTGGDITLFSGDVSGYRSLRIAATAYTESGGLMLKALEVEDPSRPIVLEENVAEQSYQEMRTTLDVPGRVLALRVWVDECPTGSIELSWGVWGLAG